MVVGEVGIGSQIAEATRFLAWAALGPVIARLAIAHGAGDAEGLNRLYHQIDGRWLRLAAGITVIAIAVMHPLITAWLGSGTGDAALYGMILTFAYGANLLTGTAIAYLRAVGRPGLEARYGGLVIIGNIALTIILGLAFGPVGVVSATAAAYGAGTLWFFVRLRHQVPPGPAPTGPSRTRVALAALAAGGITYAWGELMAQTLPRWIALVPIGVGTAAVFALYAVVATDVRPSLSLLRARTG